MRSRGNVPRSQMKRKISAKSLRKNQSHDGTQSKNANGASQPPRNSVMPRLLMANRPRYSPIKNSAYLKPEYSIRYPAIISDSPSGISKGVRLDSAVAAIMKRMNPAKPHGVNTCQSCRNPKTTDDCFSTIVTRDNEPVIITTVREEMTSGNS